MYYVLMNKQTKYKVTFVGEKGELSLEVETPLIVDSENEENVHTIIDIAIGIGELTFGENFRDQLETYAIGLEYLDADYFA